VSTSTWPFGPVMRIEGRVRLSRGSSEAQTAQRQPMIGTPCDVPVPRKVMRTRGYGVMMRFWLPWAWT